MTQEATASSGARGAAKFLAIAAVLVGIVPGLIGAFVIPHFREVYTSLGIDLPWLTRLLVDFRYLLWAPLVLSLVLWRLLRSGRAKMIGYTILLVCEVVSIPLIVLFMYLPIFNLGNAA